MMQTFPEVTIGGVLVAAFVLYAAVALGIYLLRPFLYLVHFDHLFANPRVAQLSLYVLILALLIVFLWGGACVRADRTRNTQQFGSGPAEAGQAGHIRNGRSA